MEDGDKADARAQPLRVIAKFDERFRYRAEEQIIHDLLVSLDKRIEFGRYGKDHVEVLDGQKVSGPVPDPFFFSPGLAFWAMAVPAGVV